jgi:hypothetical protein
MRYPVIVFVIRCGRDQLFRYPVVNQGFEPPGETLSYLGRQRQISALSPALGRRWQATARTNTYFAAASGPGRELELYRQAAQPSSSM